MCHGHTVTVTVMVTDNLLRHSSYRKAPPFPLSIWTITPSTYDMYVCLYADKSGRAHAHARAVMCTYDMYVCLYANKSGRAHAHAHPVR
jgi:hypothetical protein